MRYRAWACLSSIICAAAAAGEARAQGVPPVITFSARLADANAPVEGVHAIALRLFDAETGGSVIWNENHSAVEIGADGIVQLAVGSVTRLDEKTLEGGVRYLEVEVDGTTLSPRLALTSVPYALRSAVAERVEYVDTSIIQARVFDSCDSGRFMQSIAEDGSVVCGTPPVVTNMNTGGPYLPLGGSLTCNGSDKMSGINSTTGDAICTPDQDEVNTYSAGTGLTLTDDTFSVRFGPQGSATTAARSDDPRFTDARTPLSGSASYIQNQSGSPQAADLNIDGQASVGSLSAAGNIVSPRFRAMKLFDVAAGSLPLSAGFTTNGGTILIQASGSGFATAANAPRIIGMNILVDGVNRGVSRSYTNEALSHKAFVATSIVVTGLAAGNHTLQLTAFSLTSTDFNDFFDVTVIELPF